MLTAIWYLVRILAEKRFPWIFHDIPEGGFLIPAQFCHICHCFSRCCFSRRVVPIKWTPWEPLEGHWWQLRHSEWERLHRGEIGWISGWQEAHGVILAEHGGDFVVQHRPTKAHRPIAHGFWWKIIMLPTQPSCHRNRRNRAQVPSGPSGPSPSFENDVFDLRRSRVQMRVSVGGSPFLEQHHDFLDGAVACLRDSAVMGCDGQQKMAGHGRRLWHAMNKLNMS